MQAGVEIRVKGKVQGVGFRPAVWQIAHQMGLCGDVSNDSEGVLIHLPAEADIAGFISRLQAQCPPLARIDHIGQQHYTFEQCPAAFTITASGQGEMDTEIIPDAATCDVCLSELFAPATAVTVILLLTAHTAGPVSPLSGECRMIVRIPRCRFFRFVRCVSMNTVTWQIAASMLSRMPVRIADRISG